MAAYPLCVGGLRFAYPPYACCAANTSREAREWPVGGTYRDRSLIESSQLDRYGGLKPTIPNQPPLYDPSPAATDPQPALTQSPGYRPSATHLRKLENGQSAGCAASPCFTGLKWM
jgi:hypothetical protein